MEYSESVRRDTTSDFLRSFSVVSEDADFDTLSPILQEDAADGPWRVSPEQTLLPIIPFTSIHKLPVAFDSSERHCWIPRKPVVVKITKYERQTHPRRLNPNLYTIEVSHNDFHWTIRRRYKHFSHLHSELRNFRRLHSIPLPTKEHRQRRMSIRDHKQQSKFPTKLEIRIHEDELPERMQQLEEYLNTMLKCAVYRNHHETVKFFGVSHLSFVRQLGKKGYESMVKKCSGGRRINLGCCSCLKQCHLAGRWSKRWMVVKDTFVTYLDPDSGRTCDVMLMDSHFRVDCGFEETGARHGVSITNLSRRLLLKCWTWRKSREWMQHLEDAAQTTGKDFTQENRHQSFAPVREESYARWFIDGATYFAAVAEALEMAKEEIFITDWWLSPEIYLKRPMTEGDKWQLDMVLKRKAEQGVKVFVLLYKEVELAIGLNSYYSKQKLVQHHENIKVLRHPDHVTKGVLLWAHHEKIVVVDQKIAFVSGIDLCYGRWDDDQHRLTDLGSVVPNSVPGAVTADSHTLEFAAPKTMAAEVDETSNLDRNCNQEGVDEPDVRNTDDVKISVVVQSPEEVEEIIHRPKTVEFQTQDKPRSDSELEESKDEREKRLKENVLSRLKHNFFSKRINNDNKSEETLQSHIEDDVSQGASNHEAPGYDRGVSKESTFSRESRESALSKESKASAEAQNHPVRPKLRLLRSKNMSKNAGAGNTRESCPPEMDKRGGDEVDSRAKFRALVHAVKTSRSTKRWVKSSDQVEVPKDYFLRPTSPKAPKSSKKGLRDRVHAPWTGQKQEDPRPEKYTKTLDLPPDLYRTTSQQEFDKLGLLGGTKTWLGKDYVNFIFKDFENLDQPFTDFIDRTKTPRMPWHDIGSVVYGKAARDVARHFIGRWNTVKLEKAKHTSKYPFLLPKCYDDIPVPQSIKNITFGTKTQILRSCGKWSAGLSHTETSIHNAYLNLISNAKHFIYIENQFFITPIDHPDVKNGIGKALFERIMKAHRNGEKFRVYVVMPLLPGFEGAFGTATGTAIQAVTHWNYMSMYRGQYSLYSKLCAEGVRDPMQYISFYGLRTHSELVGELVTELVYVHCKLMIVDDLQVIIGSANVNDRSMLGNRDSEVAILVEDKHTFEVSLAGVPHQAGYFASSLRRTLFREHLGIEQGDSQIDVSDPVGDQFFKDVWVKQASVNTTAYEKVFNCFPTDSVVTFAELHQYIKQLPMSKANPDQARELLRKVRGHLVLTPASFLCQENLTPPSGTKEALMPVSLWT